MERLVEEKNGRAADASLAKRAVSRLERELDGARLKVDQQANALATQEAIKLEVERLRDAALAERVGGEVTK
ncbi:MAG: hypothetical protein K0U79_08410 [Gammaproteobacteria bacterium]|nr:hypothetical protein [Gammaproteobacteria bacterium]